MIRVLAVVSSIAVLAVTLAWELSPADRGRDPVAARVAPPGTRGAPPPRVNADEIAGIAETLTARPLFSPDRRRAGRSRSAPASETADASRPPRLTGTIVGPDGGRAIFADANGKPRSAAAGDIVGAFTVQAIAPGAVTVMGPDGPRVLHPAYITSQPASGQVRPPGSPR